ncbi:unnamed protein product, partial [marine sediment metagenome]
KSLRLKTTFKLGNMVMFDTNNKPRRYNSVNDIMEDWLTWRLPYYEQRKNLDIEDHNDKIEKITYKIKFIYAVMDGSERGEIPGVNIVMMKRTKANIMSQVKSMNFPDKIGSTLVTTTKLYACTFEELDKLNNKLNKLNEELQIIINTPFEDMMLTDLNVFNTMCSEWDKHNDKFKPKNGKK